MQIELPFHTPITAAVLSPSELFLPVCAKEANATVKTVKQRESSLTAIALFIDFGSLSLDRSGQQR